MYIVVLVRVLNVYNMVGAQPIYEANRVDQDYNTGNKCTMGDLAEAS